MQSIQYDVHFATLSHILSFDVASSGGLSLEDGMGNI